MDKLSRDRSKPGGCVVAVYVTYVWYEKVLACETIGCAEQGIEWCQYGTMLSVQYAINQLTIGNNEYFVSTGNNTARVQ